MFTSEFTRHSIHYKSHSKAGLAVVLFFVVFDEVQKDAFEEWFRPTLLEAGYEGIFQALLGRKDVMLLFSILGDWIRHRGFK